MELFNTLQKDSWERIGYNKRSGVLFPLFTAYSKKSLGIADLSDMKLIIDWAKTSGNSIVQFLPMNELGGLFCPYDSISSFALEPVYLALDFLKEDFEKELKVFSKEVKKKFPIQSTHVDYSFKDYKTNFLKQIYFKFQERSLGSIEEFVQDNKYWIYDFALFKALKKEFSGKPWYEWPQIYKDRQGSALDDFFKAHLEDIDFEIWLQFVLYRQFKDNKDYANGLGIFLKGDLPILVSRDSADVWAHREFFKLDFAAGAPPDMYCAKGQRWGMPTYDWEEIEKDNFLYLKEKLKYAENFYDLLRIDHVVGLFRIWSIPYEEPIENAGLKGFFDPRDNSKWETQGRKILSTIIKSTKMLICAEDLGVIPASCPIVLKEFGIPGNDIQRWVKDWSVKHAFLNPKEYRLLSVAMLSTHDTTNWPAWWENEAGTVDEQLFIRKCASFQVDYDYVKDKLFSGELSRYGRLRWKTDINSLDKLFSLFNKDGFYDKDLAEIYLNTYGEKEDIWHILGLKGRLRESYDTRLVKEITKFILSAESIFSVQLISDWLYLDDILSSDPYDNRINLPGTISAANWSVRLPISLEDLLEHKITKQIKKIVSSSGRLI